MLKRLLPGRMWWVGPLLVIAVGVAFYFVLIREAKTSITQQLLRRTRTLARAEASNLTSFFEVFGNSMAVLAQSDSMKDRQTAAMASELDAFVDQWRESDLISGIVFIDSRGIVRQNSNVLGTHDVGASLADRDYFVWAKNQPEATDYFIGEPVISRLGASKGEMIVPVAAAVYRKESFVGVIVSAIQLQPLTDRYVGMMKISDITNVFLIDEEKKLLYSNVAADAVGKSLREQFPRLYGILSSVDTTKEGNMEASFTEPKSGKIEMQLLAYAPIVFGSQQWLVVIASPMTEVTTLTAPIHIRQIMVLVLVSLSILLFGILMARDKQIQKIL